MQNTKLKWFIIGFFTMWILFMIALVSNSMAQDGDTTFYHRLSPDTMLVITFDKHCIDSIVRDYKNPDGYCPPKKVKTVWISRQ